MDLSPSASQSVRLHSAADFPATELASHAGLHARFLANGALHGLHHRTTLLNQLLPGPAEDGLFRLIVRWLQPDGQPAGWAPLAGAGLDFASSAQVVTWRSNPAGTPLRCTTSFGLHPTLKGWAWRVRLHNTGPQPLKIDVLHAQDLGLTDEAAVRNNEAYVSQYLDLLPVTDERLGHTILARQNQPASGGRHPWLGVACAQGSSAYCTDGWQFFGADHRLTGEPSAVRQRALPSQRLQYEFALAGLQSESVNLAPGAGTELVFVAAFLEDHPAASSSTDLALLHALLPATWLGQDAASAPLAANPPGTGLFVHAPWLHGARPTSDQWGAWFPGPQRHVESDATGIVQAFFHGDATHVVSRDKEAAIARPHGHILRSGTSTWIDDQQFGLTCYAAGIFGAQAYLGNPSLARLLSVVRNPLNVARASGQRVFVRHAGRWHQLGVPSAFAMKPGEVRWIYRLPDRVLSLRVWCSSRHSASTLEIRVLSGPPAEFLITHQLALGANEFESASEMEIHDDGWLAVKPAAETFLAKHLPGTCFALAALEPEHLVAHGGDELLYPDGLARMGPYAVFQTKALDRCSLLLLGSTEGSGALGGLVARLRAEADGVSPASRPPVAPLRLGGTSDAGVSRLDEILPWFTHNASIHFSAPHGLEQYGGAAWGVRDVCQGSVEWLLAAGEFNIVRRILATVFEQQYAHHPKDPGVAGCWPQWFMFAPFRFIQQTHSHGDVCFWPVKALCDYLEASNDLEFLKVGLGYTDPTTFTAAGPVEPLWAHCDRVIAHCEARFLPGTALVNYGDGDWDDTLQPADPAMRTRMVSAWTVALAYHTFGQLAEVCRRTGEQARARRLETLLARMRADFARLALPGGTVAGFLVRESDERLRPLLHPTDRVTGIRYRLLPMTRSILAGLFTPEEARHHAQIIETELRFSDGVRLMSEPAIYQGGLEKLFKRADTAANVGREIGLQYVHAHIRYAEAMARLGEADKLWAALQVINPVGLERVVRGAAPRQSNVYFSSSDADFANRIEAAARWPELRAGRVAVRSGWRLYSSGPGLYLHKVRACLLGLREHFGEVIFDPVLPRSLDGLTAETHLLGRAVTLSFRVRERGFAPSSITVNGRRLEGTPEANPYRTGGLCLAASALAQVLNPTGNRIEIDL